MLLVDADRPEPVRGGARELAVFLTPEPGAEAKEVEETIEGLLLRLEEFCSLADMIRSDTSQILEENIPLLKAKVVEMRGIYAKVDQLEAFVKMVRRHVSFLEAHVLQAERDHGALSQALRKWLGSSGLPALGNAGCFVASGNCSGQPGLRKEENPVVSGIEKAPRCSSDPVRILCCFTSQLCSPAPLCWLLSWAESTASMGAEVTSRLMARPHRNLGRADGGRKHASPSSQSPKPVSQLDDPGSSAHPWTSHGPDTTVVRSQEKEGEDYLKRWLIHGRHP
ncbi:breast carcinoma-amplified sequence 4 isoform X2 [Bos javanicus]|uniref:breast carcinoma-amplified sequence 4 isoform X2 n=1 Tax=Bos javanicus TaxID=9906 RepID=UPI002AA75684|nr:breast carcinoma-amplified sequence 4 isoform X2 [Bos javanicus]